MALPTCYTPWSVSIPDKLVVNMVKLFVSSTLVCCQYTFITCPYRRTPKIIWYTIHTFDISNFKEIHTSKSYEYSKSRRTINMAILKNKLGITNQVELNRMEEKISKQKAKQLFDSGDIHSIEIGTFKGLSEIHKYLFEDIYEFAGIVRDVNIAKKDFRFAPVMYLNQSLDYIDKMPHKSFDEIIEKYVEMNIAHPFREGNGRSTRIWLDLMLKSGIQKVIDWNLVDKEDYLMAMERSPVKDIEIKHILKKALTDKVDDRETFMNGIDVSYYYEGYSEYDIKDL